MENYLRRCLDSLIIDEEEMKQLEVLVINDGSKDSSSQIAHEYQERYPDTFRVIDKENGNYGSCINRGLMEAKGGYVKVLDADDWFDKSSFEEYLRCLKVVDVDVVVTNVCFLNNDGVLSYNTKKFPKNKILNVEEMTALWIHYVTYSLDVFKSLNYHQTEGISYTDEEFVYFPIMNVRTFYYLPVYLYRYFLGRDGQTMNINIWKRDFSQEIIVSKNLLTHWKNNSTLYGIAKRAMKDKIIVHINHFFHRVLLEYKMYDNEEVIRFDDYIRENTPDIYQLTSEMAVADPRLPFKYLKYWRQHSYSIPYINVPICGFLSLLKVGKKIIMYIFKLVSRVNTKV